MSAGLHRATKPHIRFDYGVSGIAWREVGNTRKVLARNPKEPGMIATRFVFEKSLAAFRDGGKPPASGEDGRDVLEVIAACYHSAGSGCRVRLDGVKTPGIGAMRMGAVPIP